MDGYDLTTLKRELPKTIREQLITNTQMRKGLHLAANQKIYVFQIPAAWELWRRDG